MKILLDTHIALWAITDDARLPGQAHSLIASPANEVVVSAASIWEISLKHSLGRGNMPISGRDALAYFRAAGYRLLSITAEHAAYVETLPPLHADPFDRMLVAQAQCEPMRLMTRDATVAGYGELMLLV